MTVIFSLEVDEGIGEIEISFVGKITKLISFTTVSGQSTSLGTITLDQDDNVLEEVFIIGTIDLAKDRETPVAVSTVTAADIQRNLGTQELPELLNTTSSVYATKQGGGFDQRNTAVMIKCQLVNDMENGWVFCRLELEICG